MAYMIDNNISGGNKTVNNQNVKIAELETYNNQLKKKLEDMQSQIQNNPVNSVSQVSSSPAVDYSSLYDRFYNEYLNPNLTANEKTYNNIIKNLNDTANSQIDQNEVNYRRNQRLLKEKMGRLGQTDSGLSTSDFNNLMIQRDKTNNSIKSQLASDVATQEANRASQRANLQQAASTYAANLISKLKG